jgi:hypothetical protein
VLKLFIDLLILVNFSCKPYGPKVSTIPLSIILEVWPPSIKTMFDIYSLYISSTANLWFKKLNKLYPKYVFLKYIIYLGKNSVKNIDNTVKETVKNKGNNLNIVGK